MGNRTLTTAADDVGLALRRERRAKALELRAQGYNREQIAQELTRQGYPVSHQTVKRDIAKAIAERGVEEKEAARGLILARLDQDRVRVRRALLPMLALAEGKPDDKGEEWAVAPDVKAATAAANLIGRLTRINELAARVEGVLAPTPIVQNNTLVNVSEGGAFAVVMGGMGPERIRQLAERAKERARLAELARKQLPGRAS